MPGKTDSTEATGFGAWAAAVDESEEAEGNDCRAVNGSRVVVDEETGRAAGKGGRVSADDEAVRGRKIGAATLCAVAGGERVRLPP